MGQTSIRTVHLRESVAAALITDLALVSGVIQYSEALDISRCKGYHALLLTEDIAGGAGDVDVYAEYSLDGTNWYRPYDSDLAGALTIEGNIVTALQNVARLIYYAPRAAKFMRYAFDPDANSQITAHIMFLEER